MPGLREIFGGGEVAHRTLFTVVDEQAKVDQLVQAVREVVGDLDEANTGILFVLPVSQVYGLNKPHAQNG